MKIPPIFPPTQNISTTSTANTQTPDLLYPQDSFTNNTPQNNPPATKTSLTLSFTAWVALVFSRVSLNLDINKVCSGVAEWFKSWLKPPK
jgi:hypothetical protein